MMSVFVQINRESINRKRLPAVVKKLSDNSLDKLDYPAASWESGCIIGDLYTLVILCRNFAGSRNKELRMEIFRSLKMERHVGKLRKKLPVGIDGLKKIRTNDFYYVDKTLLIKGLL